MFIFLSRNKLVLCFATIYVLWKNGQKHRVLSIAQTFFLQPFHFIKIINRYKVLNNNSRRAFYALTQEKFDDFFSCFCRNLIKFLVMGKFRIQTTRKEMRKKKNIHINIRLRWIHRRHWEMSSEKTMHEIIQSNLKNLHDTKPKARR